MSVVLWGHDAAWWTAIGTIVLAGEALVAGVVATAAYRKQQALFALERDRDKSRTELAKREQAARVAAWPRWLGPEDSDWTVFIRNGSDLPIYDVRIVWACNGYLLGGPVCEQVVPLLPPSDAPVEYLVDTSLATDLDWLQKSAWDSEGYASRLPVEVAMKFRDASSNEWIRDWQGNLDPWDPGDPRDPNSKRPKTVWFGSRPRLRDQGGWSSVYVGARERGSRKISNDREKRKAQGLITPDLRVLNEDLRLREERNLDHQRAALDR